VNSTDGILSARSCQGVQGALLDGPAQPVPPCSNIMCAHLMQDGVLEEQEVRERLRKFGRLTGVLAAELTAAVSLTPFGLRALRVKRCAKENIWTTHSSISL
jgi:hypothetical protein